MVELIRLQDHLAEVLCQRYRRHLALAFTDIVASTAYFNLYGDVTGLILLQRHIDLVHEAVSQAGGQILDTAGDGCFMSFPEVEQGIGALIALQRRISAQNAVRPPDQQLLVRCGLHCGELLTDGTCVRGRSVNLCARLASATADGQIWLTRDAYDRLPDKFQACCEFHTSLELKGFSDPVDTFRLAW